MKTTPKKFQHNLRTYLRHYREDKKLTVEGLASKLGVSKATVDKMEHKELPSPPIRYLTELGKIAELTKLSPQTFVSVLLGETNEQGKHSPLDEELLQELSRLDIKTKQFFRSIIQDPDIIAEHIKINRCLRSCSKSKNDLFHRIVNLTEKQTGAILTFINQLWGGRK